MIKFIGSIVHGGPKWYNDGFETALKLKIFNPHNDFLYSHDINKTHSDNLKFAMLISCFGGDNDTSLLTCPLQNWMSKAFVEKGADCFLGFLGENTTTNCYSGCTSCWIYSDLRTYYVDQFNTCFWGYINSGLTIRQAAINSRECQTVDQNFILINSTENGCDIPLIKEIVS
jgi:hypothetical protein